MLGTILIVILILLLIGALPRWGYHDLGYQPTDRMGVRAAGRGGDPGAHRPNLIATEKSAGLSRLSSVSPVFLRSPPARRPTAHSRLGRPLPKPSPRGPSGRSRRAFYTTTENRMNLTDRLKNYAGSAAAATRYVGTFAGGAAVAVGILGLNAINQQQVDQLFEAFNQLGTAVSGALTALGTIAGVVSAIYGAWKASRAQQVKSVSQIPAVQVHVDTSPASPAPEAVKALAEDRRDPKAADVVPMTGGPVESKS